MKFNKATKNLKSELSEMKVKNEKRLDESLSRNSVQEIVANIDIDKYVTFDEFLIAVGNAIDEAGGNEDNRDYAYDFAYELHGRDRDAISSMEDTEKFDL